MTGNINVLQTTIVNKDVMIGLITVIISIYIPVGILFLTKINQKNIFQLLDEYIILKKIFNIKRIIAYILIYFVLIYVLIILNNIYANIVVFLLLIIIIYLLVKEIISVYNRYNPKNKKEIRIKYLSQTTDLNIRKNLFSYETPNEQETELIIFSFFNVIEKIQSRSVISNLLELYQYYTKEKKAYNKLFAGYNNFSILGKLLELNYKTRSIEQYQNNEKNYGWEINIINKIISFYFNSLEKGQEYQVIYLIKKHIKEVGIIKDYKLNFFENLLGMILDSDNLIKESSFLDLLIKEFPIYEIKINNITEETNYIFEIIIGWLKEKIQYTNTEKYEYDIGVDHVLEYFFPGIDIIAFSTLLNFFFVSYDPNNRIEDFSKHKIRFGHISRIHVVGGENGAIVLKKIAEDEESYTIDFILKIFAPNKKEIKKYLEECELLLKKENLVEVEKSRINRLKYFLQKIYEKL